MFFFTRGFGKSTLGWKAITKIEVDIQDMDIDLDIDLGDPITIETSENTWESGPEIEIDLQTDGDLSVEVKFEESITVETDKDGEIMETISIKQGESRLLTFKIKQGGIVIPVTGATLSFVVKEAKADKVYVIEKANSDFIVTEAATGIVRVLITKTDSQQIPDSYVAELKIGFDDNNIIKSGDIDFVIEQSVFNLVS